MKRLVAASLLCVSSGLVSAEDFYGSVAHSMADTEFSFDGTSLDSKPTALNLIGGVTISENMSLEGVLGFGLSDDDVGPVDLQFELKQLIGVYGVGILPVTDTFNLYGKLGLVSIEFDDVDSDKADGSGVSYAIGAEIRINEQFGVAMEYGVYPDAEYEDFEVDIETTTLDLRANMYF
ncbi:MAG: porin family protein [Pseudomonadales bacterium]|nr:porin family protein [Pseudomonadales bacterium]